MKSGSGVGASKGDGGGSGVGASRAEREVAGKAAVFCSGVGAGATGVGRELVYQPRLLTRCEFPLLHQGQGGANPGDITGP